MFLKAEKMFITWIIKKFNEKGAKLEAVITHWNSRKLDKRKRFSEIFTVEE